MTSPTRLQPRPPLPYLHIDDLSVHLPAATPLPELVATLAAAAADGQVLRVAVVDQGGETVTALVNPARARLIAVSRSAVLVPRKTVPD